MNLMRVQNGEKSESKPMEITVYCKNGSTKDVELSFNIDNNLCYITF